MMIKLGGAGDRFADYLCVDWAFLHAHMDAINLQAENSPDLRGLLMCICSDWSICYLRDAEDEKKQRAEIERKRKEEEAMVAKYLEADRVKADEVSLIYNF